MFPGKITAVRLAPVSLTISYFFKRVKKMTHFYLPYLAFIFVLVMSPPLALGATLCSGPLRPSCVDMDFTYESEASTIRCEQDLSRFLDEAQQYVECLNTLIGETRDEISDAKEEFDRRNGSNGDPQAPAK